MEKDQILVTGFGTIGNTRLVNELSHGSSFANNVCRIKANENVPIGYVYAFMTSKYGKSQLNKNASGSVVRYIESPGIKKTLIPILPEETQQKIHNLITDAAQLRVEANKLLKEAVEIFEKEIEKFTMVSWTGDGIVHKGVVTDIDEVSGTKYLKVMTIFGKIRRVKMSKVKAIYTAW